MTKELCYDALLPPQWESIYLPFWFQEDFPGLDISSVIVGNTKTKAQILFKSKNCVLAGRPFVDSIFRYTNCQVSWNFEEGQVIENSEMKNIQVAVVEGPSSSLLKSERIALNLLARSSTIATNAHILSSLTKATLAGTRKTTPGFRLVEKYALAIAKADTHRMSSTDCIMLKDNHIDLFDGNIKEAITKAKSLISFTTKIEVECRSIIQAEMAINSGADIVMLDNLIPTELEIQNLKAIKPEILIEISGGITANNLHLYPIGTTLSLGSLTHSLPPLLDFSLKILK